MPRQAVYSLASRDGDQEQKELIIQNYNGEPKQELLKLIRDTFPLSRNRPQRTRFVRCGYRKSSPIAFSDFDAATFSPTPKQKSQLLQQLKELKTLIEIK